MGSWACLQHCRQPRERRPLSLGMHQHREKFLFVSFSFSKPIHFFMCNKPNNLTLPQGYGPRDCHGVWALTLEDVECSLDGVLLALSKLHQTCTWGSCILCDEPANSGNFMSFDQRTDYFRICYLGFCSDLGILCTNICGTNCGLPRAIVWLRAGNHEYIQEQFMMVCVARFLK